MFWKKKWRTEQILQHRTDNRRNFFRLLPADDRPVKIQCKKGLTLTVKEIGAGGLSFESDAFGQGTCHDIIILLPHPYAPLKTRIEVIRIEKSYLCCCRFIELDSNDMETLHQYILTEQKYILTKQKINSIHNQTPGNP